MSVIQRFIMYPSKRARDIYMGIGGLFLILAIIAFAGSTFTFDEARKAMLKPLGMVLAGLGAVLWARGSIATGGNSSST